MDEEIAYTYCGSGWDTIEVAVLGIDDNDSDLADTIDDCITFMLVRIANDKS